MRKPVYAIYEQQRRRSACGSAQSDQRLCFRWLDSIISLLSISKISSLYLASVAAQAGWSLPWSQTPEDRFSRDDAHEYYNVHGWAENTCRYTHLIARNFV